MSCAGLRALQRRRRLRRHLPGLRRRRRVAYAKEREQFGRPIASFQLVQAMIADMDVETDAARMLVWRAGYLKDTGQPNTTETSIAKLYATEAAVQLREHGDPGPRRLGLRRRPPGRALLPRRARHHAVRGHLADPEADHRPRARPGSTRWSPRDAAGGPVPQVIGVVGAGTMGAGIAQLALPRRARARCCTTRCPRRSSAASRRIQRQLERGAERGRWSADDAEAAPRAARGRRRARGPRRAASS